MLSKPSNLDDELVEAVKNLSRVVEHKSKKQNFLLGKYCVSHSSSLFFYFTVELYDDCLYIVPYVILRVFFMVKYLVLREGNLEESVTAFVNHCCSRVL